MANSDIFEWLVRYHIEHNLPRHRNSIPGEKAVAPVEVAMQEGIENKLTKGFLVLEDGSRLEQKLEKEGIILDRSKPKFKDISGYADFVSFLEAAMNMDGAFVYDSQGKRLAQISTFTNNSPAIRKIRKIQPSLIPPDFVFYGRTKPLSDEEFDAYIGTKTNAAMTLPAAYGSSSLLDKSMNVIAGIEPTKVRANQLKNSAYGHLGLGKVTRFGPKGLEKEFFLEYAPAIFDEKTLAELNRTPSHNGGLYIDREHKIVGILRTYKNDGQGVYRVSEELAYLHGGKLYTAPIPSPRKAVVEQELSQLEQTAVGNGAPACA